MLAKCCILIACQLSLSWHKYRYSALSSGVFSCNYLDDSFWWIIRYIELIVDVQLTLVTKTSIEAPIEGQFWHLDAHHLLLISFICICLYFWVSTSLIKQAKYLSNLLSLFQYFLTQCDIFSNSHTCALPNNSSNHNSHLKLKLLS